MSERKPPAGGGESSPRVLLIALNDLHRDIRLLKEAMSFHQAGFDVIRVGIQVSASDAPEEETEFGRIIRVATTSLPFVQSGDGAITRKERPKLWRAAMRIQIIDDLRHFLGRIRENRRIYAAIARLRPDVVLVGDPDTLHTGRLLQKDGAVLVYDSRELWVDQPGHSTRPLFRSLYGHLEKRVSRDADLVVAVNDLIAAELASRYRIAMPMVIQNGSLMMVEQPSPVHSPIRLLFQGYYAEDRGILQLIDCMRFLRGSAVLYLQGWGGIEELMRRKVDDEGLGDIVTFIPACEPTETVRSAQHYDVGVLPLVARTLHQRFSSPNKLYDYLSAGLVVALSDLPVHRRMVENYCCGGLVSANSSAELAEGIRDLVADPSRLYEMKLNALAAGRDTAWSVEGARLVGRVQSLLNANC